MPNHVVAIHPLTPTIGAVIEGLDLSVPCSLSEQELIASAVTEHQVVFVRGQRLTASEQHILAAQFGEVTVHPVDRIAGTPKGVTTISDTVARPPAEFDWHTDLSWTARPPRWGFLHAVEIPARGGDTLWASGFGMYERIGRRLQDLCEDLEAVHTPSADLVRSVRRNRGHEIAAELLRRHPPVRHRLVRRHAVSGRDVLWLSPLYTSHIDGLNRHESAELLSVLHRGIENPEVQIRWRWQEGDVAIWDEQSTCHRALGDHYPETRTMRRCTID